MSDEARPHVLFLCVHNAGRSQMALGWFRHLAGDRAVTRVRVLLDELGVSYTFS